VEPWEPGHHIIVRDVWQGAVLNARPVTVVEDAHALTAVHLAPGTVHATPEFTRREEGFELAARGDLAPRGRKTWHTHHSLQLVRPGDPYGVMGFWREDLTFVCWYINLQEPMRRTKLGIDTMDHVLDIIVGEDLRSWTWKDEDELAKVVELGLATSEQADEVRRNGEAVVAMLEAGEAWWGQWRSWEPDPSAPIPSLPDGWDEA